MSQRHAPATLRNREPILAVLAQVLPERGTVLEIASGSGEHALYFGPRLAPRRWLPSDIDPEALASIASWRQAEPETPVLEPLRLNTEDPDWADQLPAQAGAITAVVCINMVHIAPWSATRGLIAGAAKLLPTSGVLYLYGPYRREGTHTAPSNAAFDASLRARNPDWGIRDLEAVTELAATAGLELERVVDMPANNLSLVFRPLRSDR